MIRTIEGLDFKVHSPSLYELARIHHDETVPDPDARVLVAFNGFDWAVRYESSRHNVTRMFNLLPSESNPFPPPDKGPHIQNDALWVAEDPAYGEWDLMIAHPPCTHLAVSGARWFKDKKEEQAQAIWFFKSLCNVERIKRIAVENPVSIMSTQFRKPDQIIQPWQYGHGEVKATCLWLKNLPKLVPTNIVEGRDPRVHFASPSPDRWKERSRTLPGIAAAMADQWGAL